MTRGTPDEPERRARRRTHRVDEQRVTAQRSVWETFQTALAEWFGLSADAPERVEDGARIANEPRKEEPKEQIRRLLVEAGGKLDQAEIVERTPWAGSTISRNLSDMEHDGVVDRYRVGSGKRVVLVDD